VLVSGFIHHLKKTYPNGASAKNKYTAFKASLVHMRSMGWIERFEFPKAPFAGSNRRQKGERAFSKAERKRVAHALKREVNQILDKNDPLTGYELTICILAIALRTGMNPTPLYEMTVDSIKDHPLKVNKKLLVLYKRRGNNTPIQSLRNGKKVERSQTILADVIVMIDHIIKLNGPLRKEMSSDRVFVYRSTGTHSLNKIHFVNKSRTSNYISSFVATNELKDDNGDRLAVNVSRFRKTFENRIWELSGGDPFVTAALSNHSIKVSDTHYLEAPREAETNFNFMGEIRSQQLLSNLTSAENNTPVSKCSRAPKRIEDDGVKIYCTNFLKCVVCRHMVVTKEDLNRLFSFYWLIIHERKQIGAKRWKKYFSHIVRIIDTNIAPQFEPILVKKIKAEAKLNPHPAWKSRQQLEISDEKNNIE
jgi:integrase